MALARFIAAQEPVYDIVLAELRAGRKQSHWIWFIFPQLRALGRSPLSLAFGIENLEEARAYLRHPVLGARLRQCTALVNATAGHSIHEILDSPDDMKFRSSMTLFLKAAEAEEADGAVFREALELHYGGRADRLTLELVEG